MVNYKFTGFIKNMRLGKLTPIILPTKIEQIDSKLYRGNAVFSPIKALRIKK